jgi:hypothetical protein
LGRRHSKNQFELHPIDRLADLEFPAAPLEAGCDHGKVAELAHQRQKQTKTCRGVLAFLISKYKIKSEY